MGGYGTNNDTKPVKESKDDSQVIDNNGGREGIRTPGLLVANEALSQLSYSPTSSNPLSLAEVTTTLQNFRSWGFWPDGEWEL